MDYLMAIRLVTLMIKSNLTNANLTGTTFKEAHLEGADFSGTTRDGVQWISTYCPDGVNSFEHDNTCEGHLTPVYP